MPTPLESVAVVILAGGFGTRIRHLLADIPKPMAPVLDRPFLEWIICFLKKQGFRNIVISTGFLGEKIEEHFARNPVKDVCVTCVREIEPLGTGGGFVFAAKRSELKPFAWLVLNGDSLAFAPLKELVATLDSDSIDGALLGVEMNDASRFGTISADTEGRLQRFEEKRTGAGIINAGMYLFREKTIEQFPDKRPLSFENDVFPTLLTQGAALRVVVAQTPFLDIGTPESLAEAESFIKQNMEEFAPL